MSRKTREEKKLADYRRRLRLLHRNQPQTSELTAREKMETDQDTKTQSAVTKIDLKQQTYFKTDLKKSLKFICLIITLEIVIYFARMNRYF